MSESIAIAAIVAITAIVMVLIVGHDVKDVFYMKYNRRIPSLMDVICGGSDGDEDK